MRSIRYRFKKVAAVAFHLTTGNYGNYYARGCNSDD